MARITRQPPNNGFYGIGIVNHSNSLNIGSLWRSAYILGAAFIFTTGRKYRHQGSDVTSAWARIPLYHYPTLSDLKANLPHATPLIGVEMSADATPLTVFQHPDRAIYLLGNEQAGLSASQLSTCHKVVSLPGNFSLNVAVAGSIVMYDRAAKLPSRLPERHRQAN